MTTPAVEWIVLPLILLVQGGPAERADTHGDPLPAGALLRLGTSRFRQPGYVYSIAHSPDGKLLATGNAGTSSIIEDASVVVWDAETGKRIRTWHGHAHVVGHLAFSHDSKLLAVVNGYGKLLVYDIATGKEPYHFKIERPGQAFFTPDHKLMVSEGALIRRWDLATAKELTSLAGHDKAVQGLTLSNDGKTIAAYGRDGAVRIWDADGRERRRFTVPLREGMVARLSRDGQFLACGTFDDQVCVWDVAAGRELWRVKTPSWRVSAQAFSLDNQTLATGGEGIALWDVRTGKPLRSLPGWYGTHQHVLYAPDGKRIASAGTEASPRFWDAATLDEDRRFDGHQHELVSAAFTPDGKALAICSNEPFVHLWDLSTLKYRRVGTGTQGIHSFAITPDGNGMVIARRYEAPKLWHVDSDKETRSFPVKDQFMLGGAVFLSGDGKVLAGGDGACGVRFWDVATGKETIAKFQGQVSPTGGDRSHYVKFVLAPNGKSLATTRSNYHESSVILWDAAARQVRVQLAERGLPAAFTPDSRLVAVLADKEVRLVDAVTGLTARQMKGDAKRVTCAAFSPDGRTLATAGDDRTVYLWETLSGERRGKFAGHEGPVRFVAFAPDGRRLASGGEDHTALLWDLSAVAEIGPLSDKQREQHWAALAGSDGFAAYRAIWALAGDANASIAYLKPRLRVEPLADPKRLTRWIAELDSDDFDERRQASQELEQLGELAVSPLRHALNGKITLEFRRRVESLLQHIATQPPTPERFRQVRAVEVLERAGNAGARQLLDTLAAGDPEARLTQDAKAARDRLARVAAAR